MAMIDELDTYRSPRQAFASGLDVREITPERIFVQPDGTAARPVSEVRNPNVGAGGSAEARAFRAASAAPDIAAAPAAQTMTRAQRVASGLGVRRAAAALVPTTPAGLALTAAAAVPTFAEMGRERGAGRDFQNQNAGNPAAGDLRPGQLGSIRADALQQARGQALRAAYADPSLAAQDIGSFGAGVQRRALDIAAANTPRPPTGAGAGRGFVNPASVALSAAGGSGVGLPPVGGRVPVQDIAAGAAQDDQRGGIVIPGGFPGEAALREARALSVERENSPLRRQLDAYGPGAHNADGTGGLVVIGNSRADEANRDTTIDALRFESRVASGRRSAELEHAAQQLQASQQQRDIAELNNQAAAAREGAAAATTRRGQDLTLEAARGRDNASISVERERGRTARDVADRSGDARVAAAEAKGLRPVVVDMGEEVIETPAGPQKVKRPSLVIDSNTGKVLDIAGPSARAPGAQSIATDPRAIAIRDDPKLTLAEKRSKLKDLGYQ